jgi:hypothetical protein
MSLVIDDALWLRIELPSPGVDVARKGIEIPEMEEAAEASPRREGSFSGGDPGRRSGKRELTRVMISDGQMTRKG